MKKILSVHQAPQPHWVGNGFPVRSLFSYHDDPRLHSPFLLLDHAGPAEFPADGQKRGVGEHPHRGFETVTLVYEGEIEHRDSTGGGGMIGPGDVQWMTAGAGILHEEFHSPAFSRQGGRLHMVQLWVNLPARKKTTPAAYQAIAANQIPTLSLPDQSGALRVIAGEYAGISGPAHTHTPMQVWDLQLKAGKQLSVELTPGWTANIVILKGTVQLNQQAIVREGQLVLLETAGSTVLLEANNDALVLILSGQPIEEPVVGYGPFVMNTQEEIDQAIQQFQQGRFSQSSAVS